MEKIQHQYLLAALHKLKVLGPLQRNAVFMFLLAVPLLSSCASRARLVNTEGASFVSPGSVPAALAEKRRLSPAPGTQAAFSGRKTDKTGEIDNSFGDFERDEDESGWFKRDWPMALFIALLAVAVGVM